MKKIMVFASVWPEPKSSAAGGRMLQLLQTFLAHQYQICYACSAAPSEFAYDIEALGITTVEVALNCNKVDTLIQSFSPEVVMFDRFMVEEQFGWRVAKVAPNALRILNTEDLHCVRKSRHEAIKAGKPWDETFLLSSEVAKREIASILRCDISLMISTVEMKWLTHLFQVPSHLLFYYPFVVQERLEEVAFNKRQGFMTIGNFKHEPNWQSVLTLKNDIWPHIRKLLPKAEIKVYGSYASQKVWQLHQPRQGFLIKGRAENAQEVMQEARVCLAPLTFGAGLKGKLLESMMFGTPSVTTNIGAEGMTDEQQRWNGSITNDWKLFAEKAVALHENESTWLEAQKTGEQLLQSFSNEGILVQLIEKINHVMSQLSAHRQGNFTGAMLMHHRLQSTKYMSKWIHAKNAS